MASAPRTGDRASARARRRRRSLAALSVLVADRVVEVLRPVAEVRPVDPRHVVADVVAVDAHRVAPLAVEVPDPGATARAALHVAVQPEVARAEPAAVPRRAG